MKPHKYLLLGNTLKYRDPHKAKMEHIQTPSFFPLTYNKPPLCKKGLLSSCHIISTHKVLKYTLLYTHSTETAFISLCVHFILKQTRTSEKSLNAAATVFFLKCWWVGSQYPKKCIVCITLYLHLFVFLKALL